jgi:hypothetical protein
MTNAQIIPMPERESAGWCPFCDGNKTAFTPAATYERECSECGHQWDGECRGIDGNIDLRGDGT